MRYSVHIRRTAGIALILLGSTLLLVGAVLLYLAYVRSLPYSLGALLLALAVIGLAVFALRRAARMFGLARPAFVGVVIVAMVFVLAAIVVTGLLTGRDRKRQIQTMSDLRKIAAALEDRASAEKSFPRVGAIQELERHLTPTYMRELPQRDGWGHTLRYEWLPEGYAIASAGRDGIWERPHLREYTPATTTSPDADIVFASGTFVQFPDSGPHPY